MAFDLPVLIIHGWSDNSKSFESLATFLRGQGAQVIDIRLGDYISMRDRVTLYDIGLAMRRALAGAHVNETRYSFDCVVHSTGGLVIREFLRQVCGDDASLTPVRNLVMLAPANYGSPLAKIGKSLTGRIVKGWDWESSRFGETGERILDALEMSSPYSWALALEDLVGNRSALFTAGNCRCTVMVGSNKYGGLSGFTHIAGGDGTVLVSTANLNLIHYAVDFANPDKPKLTVEKENPAAIALAVFDRNHGTITEAQGSGLPQVTEWQAIFMAALNVTQTGYSAHVKACDKQTQLTFSTGKGDNFHQYMHVVFRARDQFGQPIPDYVVDFYQRDDDNTDKVYRKIHGDVLEKVWTNTRDASYRSFLLDLTDLAAFMKKNPKAKVDLSIAAARVSAEVGYLNPSQPAAGIRVFEAGKGKFWHWNQTVFVDLTLHRDPIPEVFTLRPAP
jgi:pimeloyl-ACP methyl ester carboxylesterase